MSTQALHKINDLKFVKVRSGRALKNFVSSWRYQKVWLSKISVLLRFSFYSLKTYKYEN